MVEKLSQEDEVITQAISDFDSLQDEIEFNPEEALRLQKKHKLVHDYIDRLRKETEDEEFINYYRRIAESVADMLLDPESLKALRKKRIERIDGGNAEGDQEGTTDEHIKNSIAFGMDTDFWRSPEYLEYCKEKAPEIYSPDPAQVAKDVAPFLEKTNDEIALFAFESCAETIEKGDIYDGISRTTKIVASEFVLDIPEDMQIKLGFLADMDSPPDGITTETDAFFYKEDNTVYLTKPLEFYGENPIDTIALIAHEVFHGYQYYISEKQKDHPKSDIYTENWGHYIPMSTDIEAYMHQLVEAEAYIFQIGLRNQLINSKQGVVA